MKRIYSLFNTAREAGSASWLVFFRINIALFALLHFAAIQPDFNALFSYSGYIYPDVLDVSGKGHIFTVTGICTFIGKYLGSVSYGSVLLACRILYPVSLLCLMLGLFTRVSAVLALMLQLILINSISLYQYGVDVFTTIALFYCCLFPVGRVWSLDNLVFAGPRAINYQREFLFLLRAHMGLVYFFSGMHKLIGESWHNGEAIWKTIHQYNNGIAVDVDFLAGSPLFFVAGWLTVTIEVLYPVLMSFRVTRSYCLAAIIMLHILIAVFLGLYFFSTLMIILNLAAYYVPYYVSSGAVSKARPGNDSAAVLATN